MTLQMRDPTTRKSTYPFPRHFGPPEWFEHWEPLRWLFEQQRAADVPVEERVEDDQVVLRIAVPDIDRRDVQVRHTDGILTVRFPADHERTAPVNIPVESG